MLKNSRGNLGFTLIELLVVIAIIALLASIVLASLQQARFKALSAKSVEQLKQVELAFRLWGNNAGWQKWPDTKATSWDCNAKFRGFSPSLTTIASNCPEFNKYLSTIPQPLPGTSAEYQYRTAGDTGDTCGDTYQGVTIRISIPPSSLDTQKQLDYANALDKIIDSNNQIPAGKFPCNCGRLRFTSSLSSLPCGGSDSIYYRLGNSRDDFY